MTRARKSDLVMDGNEVKFRLKAERLASSVPVHVDWVRFTVRRRSAPLPSVDDLFPGRSAGLPVMRERLLKALRELPDPDFSAAVQAKDLAQAACDALGPDFSVFPEVRKGHDFYRCRWSIMRNDSECGWVGFLASGESPRQLAQNETLHCNLYGTACTFAEHGFNHRLAKLCRDREAILTRVDLALDFFDGIRGGMERVESDYRNGLMNSQGKRLSCNVVGDWPNSRARSFYVGSKEAGKQTNVYEKGHQLFGPKDDSPWVRVELRYGNKLRVLDHDILNRPADYFAGASDWHFQVLSEAEHDALPLQVPCTVRRATESIFAEVKRNVRWLRDTAAPSLAMAFQYLNENDFLELVSNQKAPGRLQKFSKGEVSSAYGRAFKKLSGSVFGRPGLQPFCAATT
jgi:phage replication initiation protein